MTISVSDNTPRVSYSVSEGATQTSFTVSFEFFADADLNVYVDGTKKTLTTHYSVTGGDGSTGSISISVTGASGGSTVVITRGIALERTTDFPVSGAFAVGTLNTELDRFVAIQADLNDTITRSVRLQDDDSAVSMELPLKAARLGTVLGFNASTGAVEAGPTIANVNSLSAITANINTVAGISANVTTVAGIHGNVTTVAGISSNVTTVAGISSNVTTVAGKASLITSDFAADMALIDSTFVTKMNLVTSDFVTDMAAVTSDFISDLNLVATSSVIEDLNLLGTSGVIEDLNLLATSAIVEDLNLLATSSVIADMATLAGSGASPNITSVTASGAITAGSFVIGSADINENDLEAIDGVTAGTVAASKAVVVDTNKDISSFRNLTATGEVGVGRLNLSSTVSSSDLGSDAAQVGYSSSDGLLLMGQGSANDVALINDLGNVVARIPTGLQQFVVNGSFQVSGSTGGKAYLTTSEQTVVADDSLGALEWYSPSETSGTDSTGKSGAIECVAEGEFTATANPTKMEFKLGVSEAATTKMTLSSNGDLNVTGGITTGGVTVSTADNSAQLNLTSTDSDASNGPRLVLQRDSGSPADNDVLGQIEWYGENDASEAIEQAKITVTAIDVTDGTEDSALNISTKVSSSTRSRIYMPPTETVFNEESDDLDFRVESNGNANMLFVDGGNDRVGIGTNAPTGVLDITGANSATVSIIAPTDNATLELRGGNSDSAVEEANIVFYQNNAAKWQLGNATDNLFKLYNYATSSYALTINASSDIDVETGDIFFSTAGKGIVLGATSNTAANTLDDYEEGTFTGTLAGYYSSPTSAVTATGYYTKIGRSVHFGIDFGTIDTTGGSGNMWMSGLPFTSTGYYSIGGVQMNSSGTFPSSAPFNLVSGNVAYFYKHVSNGNITAVFHNAGTGRGLRLSNTYITTA